MRFMYAPCTPSAIMMTPSSSARPHTAQSHGAQPTVAAQMMSAMKPMSESPHTAPPSQPTIVSGLSEKPMMPSKASFSIFLRVYFVLPA